MRINFKKDKVSLLKALREVVTDNMEYGEINPQIDRDVADLMLELTNKKHLRRLKLIRKELDKLIDEVLTDENRKNESYEYREARRQKITENLLAEVAMATQ
jgi:hypothetical protein